MALTRIKNTAITLDAAEIPNISADKITSGTLADARISSSSVVQHSPETDLQPIKADITALALREATNEASVAFNLPGQFIDTFTDDTNLGTQTTVDRDSDGYVSSVYGSAGPRFATTKVGNAQQDTSVFKFGTGSLYNASNSGDYLKTGTLTGLTGMPTTGNWSIECWAKYAAVSISGTERILGIGDGAGDGDNEFSFGYQSTTTNMNFYENGTNHTHTSWPARDTDWHHYFAQGSGSGTIYTWMDGVYQFSYTNASDNLTGTAGTFLQMGGRTGSSTEDFVGYLDEVRISNIHRHTNSTNFTVPAAAFTTDANTMALLHMDTSDLVDSSVDNVSVNATGTLIQSANAVGSAKTKVGGTMLYKDNAGTNTLGTDLKIYFTCNGGTNWTEAASYNAVTPVYSTGVKQVRLGETTCTSGTDVRYKAVWANQADGSKEARLHGIGINY